MAMEVKYRPCNWIDYNKAKVACNFMIFKALLVGRDGFEASTNGLKDRLLKYKRLILLTFLPQIPLRFAEKYIALHS